jgi:hypothetical protein
MPTNPDSGVEIVLRHGYWRFAILVWGNSTRQCFQMGIVRV